MTELDEVKSRIRELELEHNRLANQKKRWLWYVVLGCLLALPLIVGGARRDAEKLIASQAFMLVDEAGKIRGMMTASSLDGPELTFVDKDAKIRMRIHLAKDGSPKITLTGKTTAVGTAPYAELNIEEGTPALWISSAGPNGPEFMAGVLADGSPTMHLRRDEKSSISLGISSKNTSKLSFNNTATSKIIAELPAVEK